LGIGLVPPELHVLLLFNGVVFGLFDCPPDDCRLDFPFSTDVSSKTATYVKYRNPNFSESPSLDELLRNDADEANRKPDVVEVEVTQKRESTTVVNGQLKKQVTKDNFIK